MPLAAQEAIFRNLDAERQATQMRSRVEQSPYTARWKDLRLQVSSSLGLEWNDNVRLQEDSTEADFIIRPQVNLHAFHPIGEANVFTVDLGVGYRKYIDADDLDQLLITPGSTLSYNMFIKEVQVNLHNRMSYRVDAVEFGGVSGRGDYGGLDNALGFFVNVPVSRGSISGGYDWIRFLASDTDFDEQDRQSHQGFARAGVQVLPELVAGVEGSAAATIYDDSFFNDNTSYSGGLFARWEVSETLYVEPRGGYTLTIFDPNQLADPGDYDSFYFGLGMDHRPNETVRYNLDVRKEVQPGINANLTDILRARLGATWSVIREVPLRTGVFYEHGKEARGLFTERYDRYGGDVTLSYKPMQKMTASLGYSLTYKDSETEDRDYLQNRITLNIAYQF